MLERIASYHWIWIDFTARFCDDYYYVQDIVQEMYLKCATLPDQDKLEKDGDVNKSYIFAILRNLCTDYYRAKKRVKKTDLEELQDVVFDDDYIEYNNDLFETHKDVREKLKKEHPYYDLMYMTYTSSENPSMRDIAKGSGISVATVFNDIKKIKSIISDEAEYFYKPDIKKTPLLLAIGFLLCGSGTPSTKPIYKTTNLYDFNNSSTITPREGVGFLVSNGVYDGDLNNNRFNGHKSLYITYSEDWDIDEIIKDKENHKR